LVTFTVIGGMGGGTKASNSSGNGGYGGNVTTTLAVVPNTVYYIYVGNNGGFGDNTNIGGKGGASADSTINKTYGICSGGIGSRYAGGGGAASYVAFSNVQDQKPIPVIIAGGGGGAGYYTTGGSGCVILDGSSVSDGSEIFRTNLYPIAFNSAKPELWKQNGLDIITGFKEKNLFKTWCFLNRFPAISKIVEEKSPKLIIGTGVNYLTDFFVCYAGSLNSDNIINVGELKTKKRQYYWARIGENTTLVVIPFFSSQSGLNSNELLQEMGEKIRELVPNL
jgi:hypothetical protein